MPGEQITVPKFAVQVVFDALCHSLDFGSGFLDTDEVNALRQLAVVLGVDPNEATPGQFVARYPHAFEGEEDRIRIAAMVGAFHPRRITKDGNDIDESLMPDHTPCKVGDWGHMCLKAESDPIHQAEPAT